MAPRSFAAKECNRQIRQVICLLSLSFVLSNSLAFASSCVESTLSASIQDLRSKNIVITAELTKSQEKELTQMLQLLSIRRSRFNRAYHRSKQYLGLHSLEYSPIIEKGKALNPFGDEARVLVSQFNRDSALPDADQKQLLDKLLDDLYAVYIKRAEEPILKPEYTINGVPKSMNEFINAHGYYQPELDPSNTWMTVGRLRPETVQNPMLKGLVREMWWNRTTGIHPKGTTRIARNIKLLPDGKEELLSVEVIYRGEGKAFVPFVYEPDKDGVFRLIHGPGARKRMMTCFGCHLRLSGIFFGGISMKNYKPSPDWYINAIDYTRYEFHKKFEGLIKK